MLFRSQYIISKKLRKLAIIAGGRDLTVTAHRLKGCISALENANLEYDPSNLLIGDFDEDTGYKFGIQLAESGADVDAVIATDDVLAFGVATALREKGIRIPEDIAVASFNNSILSRKCHIPITSIEIHPDRLGEEAVKLLVSAIENGTRGLKIIISHTIMKRLSTEG